MSPTSLLMLERKKSRNIGSKSKRLLIDNQDVLALRLTWEEVQGMLRPPQSATPSVVMIEDYEFEEYEVSHALIITCWSFFCFAGNVLWSIDIFIFLTYLYISGEHIEPVAAHARFVKLNYAKPSIFVQNNSIWFTKVSLHSWMELTFMSLLDIVYVCCMHLPLNVFIFSILFFFFLCFLYRNLQFLGRTVFSQAIHLGIDSLLSILLNFKSHNKYENTSE